MSLENATASDQSGSGPWELVMALSHDPVALEYECARTRLGTRQVVFVVAQALDEKSAENRL